MPPTTTVKFQIGKNGVNSGVVDSLRLAFKHHKVARISVLKSAARDKTEIAKMADELVSALGKNYRYSIIGFTIVLRRGGQIKQGL